MRARFFRLQIFAYLLTASFLLVAAGPSFTRPTAEARAEQQSATSPAVARPRIDPQAWFAKGQAALEAGDLDAAEAAFRQVLAADPRAGSAYANLGVIALRPKDL